MKNMNYYLGLDIGTDSVGYAVTDESYELQKFGGEPMWGVTTFEAANDAAERRLKRTARRSLDRRQQRVYLLEELFATEIGKIDPEFFIRRRESALFAEDTQFGVSILGNRETDQDYHKQYPTIHHLIVDLMNSSNPHDVRLIYLACAWLVAHRGHFLSEVSADQIRSFHGPYEDFCAHFRENRQIDLPWPEDAAQDEIAAILKKQQGVSRKKEEFFRTIMGCKKPPKAGSDDYPLSKDGIVGLLCGGAVKLKDLFQNAEYEEIKSIALSCDEETLEEVLAQLNDEDGELLRLMRKLYDCILLNTILSDEKGGTHPSISAAKVAVYDRHAEDLKWLKQFIRKYCPKQYFKLFRGVENNNYTSYSHNTQSCAEAEKIKFAKKNDFCDYLKKVVKDIKVDEADRERYDDMMTRLELYTFLPKQKDPDNRVIPHQLYQAELERILANAAAYLPFLSEKDENGLTVAQKIVSVFSFRIPYFVGPLNKNSEHAWIARKAEGKIYPWNFESLVDLDASEEAFIRRMTNTCTYLPGEPVLPECSLLYSRFIVLNTINNLKVNDKPIPVDVKQQIFQALFVDQSKKATKASIRRFLTSCGLMAKEDELSGVDDNVNASLHSYHAFRNLLTSGVLTEEDVEEIINRAAFSEDQRRMVRWLQEKYPQLSQADVRYISRMKLKGFGRLSRKLLTEMFGVGDESTGEAMSIMDMLWNTNENLMQLLSEKYQFKAAVAAFAKEYYADSKHRKTLSQRLDDLYVSNAVKRPIIRTLDIVSDVVKAAGAAPAKIFIEMARGATPDQKGKRTQTRKEQLLALYKSMKNDPEARRFEQMIAEMGDMADNRLQSDKLFLYCIQMGKCMYTGKTIDLGQLGTKLYDVDHIYPQSKIKDDSILNNKVLVLSEVNGEKDNVYPIRADIRANMHGFWAKLHENHLITDEKFKRLTRSHPFSEDELRQFINRQLVETRQSTKVVAQLLQELYPDAEIVYVKAGMVSEFRQEFDMLKCRSVNDLHHAKDAYLNIVVGNVYHERFTRRWFNVNQEYSLNTRTVFGRPVIVSGKTVWRGGDDLAVVRKMMGKNAVHLTRYAFCRKGGLFDQNPVKAAEGLVPRKAGLNTEKYGGYNKTTASYYMLVSFEIDGKKDAILVPIELRYADRVQTDEQFAENYLKRVVASIVKKPVTNISVQLGGRKIKIYSLLSLDGLMMELRGKMNGGAYVIAALNSPLIVGHEHELYIKKLESFSAKREGNKAIVPDEAHDGICRQKNNELFEILCKKLETGAFAKIPSREKVYSTMRSGLVKFAELSTEAQVECLLSVVRWFGAMSTCNLKEIGGVAQAGAKYIGARLSQIGKAYHDVRLIDRSPAGLFECRSENLLELLK